MLFFFLFSCSLALRFFVLCRVSARAVLLIIRPVSLSRSIPPCLFTHPFPRRTFFRFLSVVHEGLSFWFFNCVGCFYPVLPIKLCCFFSPFTPVPASQSVPPDYKKRLWFLTLPVFSPTVRLSLLPVPLYERALFGISHGLRVGFLSLLAHY